SPSTYTRGTLAKNCCNIPSDPACTSATSTPATRTVSGSVASIDSNTRNVAERTTCPVAGSMTGPGPKPYSKAIVSALSVLRVIRQVEVIRRALDNVPIRVSVEHKNATRLLHRHREKTSSREHIPLGSVRPDTDTRRQCCGETVHLRAQPRRQVIQARIPVVPGDVSGPHLADRAANDRHPRPVLHPSKIHTPRRLRGNDTGLLRPVRLPRHRTAR